MKKAFWVLFLFLAGACFAQERGVRQVLEDLVLERDVDEAAALEYLSNSGDMFVSEFFEAWKVRDVLSYQPDGEEPQVYMLVSGKYYELITWEEREFSETEEALLKKMRPARKLRRTFTGVIDVIGVSAPEVSVRRDAVLELGKSRKVQHLELLREKRDLESNDGVVNAFDEAISLILLEHHETPEELQGAVVTLGNLKSSVSKGSLGKIQKEAEESGNDALAEAASSALRKIESHEEFLKHAGSVFRGISTGSVLLIVAFGLAITFGLMGIINMAHGEFIAIGGYTLYVIQDYVGAWYGTDSAIYQWTFWISIPLAFLVAGLLGYGLEKSFFRFLYKRPLESLLATWGLSMIMRQGFRTIFGPKNVMIDNPDLLSQNFEYGGIAMSEARIFAIIFSVFVCFLTWALLTKTNLGLYIRAVMQNRAMAGSLGIPVKSVNSLTFAFGCGLAAMAGVILSQIGNVDPGMGQRYIVDSFMVVVSGGVGSLLGAGISALGIGVVDQMLQPPLGPVMGKIAVLGMVILFLQWKPGGLFPTKSRSMDD